MKLKSIKMVQEPWLILIILLGGLADYFDKKLVDLAEARVDCLVCL